METISASYTKFLSHLKELTQKKESIYIFFTTEDKHKHAGRIIMLQGEIIHVHYANKSGNDAITMLAGIEQLKYRLQPNPPKTMRDGSLPDTDSIIKGLTPSAGTAGNESLSVESRQAILSCLTDVVGPMAEVICEEHFSQGGSTSAVVSAICAELSDDESQEFYQLISQIIN